MDPSTGFALETFDDGENSQVLSSAGLEAVRPTTTTMSMWVYSRRGY